MKTLTADDSSFVAQLCPENGEAVDEAIMEVALQSAADRAEYAERKAENARVLLANGVRKIRVVNDQVALKALTGMAAHEVAEIHSGNTAAGLYVFRIGAALPDGLDIPKWAYLANDASGAWTRHELPMVTFDGPNGSQKGKWNRDYVSVPNAILEDGYSSWDTALIALAFGGSGVQDTGLKTDTIAVQQGDRVTVHFQAGSLEPGGLNGVSLLLCRSIDGGTTWAEIPTSESLVLLDPLPTHSRIPVACMARYNVPNGVTSVQFQARAKGANGSTASLRGPFRIQYLAIRPLVRELVGSRKCNRRCQDR